MGVREIAFGLNPATPSTGINPDQNSIDNDDDEIDIHSSTGSVVISIDFFLLSSPRC